MNFETRTNTDTRSPWTDAFRELGSLPNVACKLSGLVTEAVRPGWTRDDLRYYLDTALEVFGPDRLMIGSDWPVCTLACEYELTLSIMRDHVAALTHVERAAIESATARRCYRM